MYWLVLADNISTVLGANDQEVLHKLAASCLLVLPSDTNAYCCLACGANVRKVEVSNYLLGYRFRCLSCDKTLNPTENTWFKYLRETKNEGNPILRSLIIAYYFVCGIRVGLAAVETDSNYVRQLGFSGCVEKLPANNSKTQLGK